jgi:excisionase family DNA binding protein
MSILRKLREQTRPLGVKEVAELFDVTESTIQRWIRRGEIPAIRVSDTIRIDPVVLADWIERRGIFWQIRRGRKTSTRPLAAGEKNILGSLRRNCCSVAALYIFVFLTTAAYQSECGDPSAA